MTAFFSPFSHSRDHDAGAGGRWEEQSERGRERTLAVMNYINPEDWQHRGRGNWMTLTAQTNGFMMVKGIPVESDAWA